MNIYTADIIIAILLIVLTNNPILHVLQNSFGLNFVISEVIIGIVLIIIMVLIHKFVLKKIMK